MKKILFVVGLLILSLSAQAQFEKGNWIVNPSVSGLGFSWNKNAKATFGFGVEGGAFIVDNVALLVEGAAEWTSPIDAYQIGVGGRYYFEKIGIYLGAGLNATRYDFKHFNNITDFGLKAQVGYAFFVAKNVTIEPALYYNQSFKDSDYSELGFKIGFGLYF